MLVASLLATSFSVMAKQERMWPRSRGSSQRSCWAREPYLHAGGGCNRAGERGECWWGVRGARRRVLAGRHAPSPACPPPLPTHTTSSPAAAAAAAVPPPGQHLHVAGVRGAAVEHLWRPHAAAHHLQDSTPPQAPPHRSSEMHERGRRHAFWASDRPAHCMCRRAMEGDAPTRPGPHAAGLQEPGGVLGGGALPPIWEVVAWPMTTKDLPTWEGGRPVQGATMLEREMREDASCRVRAQPQGSKGAGPLGLARGQYVGQPHPPPGHAPGGHPPRTGERSRGWSAPRPAGSGARSRGPAAACAAGWQPCLQGAPREGVGGGSRRLADCRLLTPGHGGRPAIKQPTACAHDAASTKRPAARQLPGSFPPPTCRHPQIPQPLLPRLGLQLLCQGVDGPALVGLGMRLQGGL